MNVIYILIPFTLLLGLVFIGLFIWMTKKGQYDDLETPAVRMLFDDNNEIINNKGRENYE